MDRHDLDLTSLIAGLLFTTLGALFLSEALGGVDLALRWVWPSLLTALGIAFLVGARNGHGDRGKPVPDAGGEPGTTLEAVEEGGEAAPEERRESDTS